MTEKQTAEPLWVKEPRILVDEWDNLWPFDKTLTREERTNAGTRLVALAALGATLYTQKLQYLYYGLGGLAAVLMWYELNKPLESELPKDDQGAAKLAQMPPTVFPLPYGSKYGYHDAYLPDYHQYRYYNTYPWPNPLVGYNDLGNEQTNFGFNNAADPSDTVNRYTLDAAENKARFEMKYTQGIDVPTGSLTKRDAATQATQMTEHPYSLTDAEKLVTQRTDYRGPLRQDIRSEAFSGMIPRWDAMAAMQMDPQETTYEHQGGYGARSYGTDDVLKDDVPQDDVLKAGRDHDATQHYDDTAHRAGVGEFEPMGARDNPLVTGDNPYGNPHIYQGHEAGQMRRPRQPDEMDVYRMSRDHAQRDAVKMYYGAGELDEGLFINPLPDPTLQARPVFFPESSEWDRHIVGSSNIRGGHMI